MYQLDQTMSFEAQLIATLKHYAIKIFISNWPLKYGLGVSVATLHGILGEASAMLEDHWFQLCFFLVLICVDHLTGWAASKLNGEKTISKAWRLFSLKLAIYYPPLFMLILTPHLIQSPAVQGVMQAGLDVILTVYAVGEIISLRENMAKGHDLLAQKLKNWTWFK